MSIDVGKALRMGQNRTELRLTYRGTDITLSIHGDAPDGGPSLHVCAESISGVVASSISNERPALNRERQGECNVQVSGSGCHAFFRIDPRDYDAASAWLDGVYGAQS
ncbi:MAG: hypothetical protein LC121_16095 [Anaerolineae bacterium]|nr:hypothetical protein [Anaerolineae bacterium]